MIQNRRTFDWSNLGVICVPRYTKPKGDHFNGKGREREGTTCRLLGGMASDLLKLIL